jgi:hypothetical protein
VAVAGRVEDDRLVTAAPPRFAFDEPLGVFHNPADRRGGQIRLGRVAASPSHHRFGRVHVNDLRPGRGCRQRGPPGVGKQVQNPQRSAGAANPGFDPVPVSRLFRKNPQLAQRRGPQLESDRLVPNRPVVRPLPQLLPVSRPVGGPFVANVRLIPDVGHAARARVRRRARAIHDNPPKPLQPPAIAKIHQFVVTRTKHASNIACAGQGQQHR